MWSQGEKFRKHTFNFCDLLVVTIKTTGSIFCSSSHTALDNVLEDRCSKNCGSAKQVSNSTYKKLEGLKKVSLLLKMNTDPAK